MRETPLMEPHGELNPQQETALQAGMTQLPTPSVKAEFNREVLLTLVSGADFESWGQQAKTRVKWMALPALVGFGLTLLVAMLRQDTFPSDPTPRREQVFTAGQQEWNRLQDPEVAEPERRHIPIERWAQRPRPLEAPPLPQTMGPWIKTSEPLVPPASPKPEPSRTPLRAKAAPDRSQEKSR